MTNPDIFEDRGPGFYKRVTDDLLYGLDVQGPTYHLTVDNPGSVDGWRWFDTETEALVELAPPIADTSEVVRTKVETGALAAISDLQKIVNSTGTLTTAQLTSATRLIARATIYLIRLQLGKLDQDI